jgi:uncharacterized protein (DUF983 family)
LSQLSYGTLIGRALRLRCPRCGHGKLFTGVLTMAHHCPECGFVFERAPGYFLGSAYLNYGFMAITLTTLYMGLHFGLGYSNELLAIPLGAYCVIVPLILFRYARAWWLAMDCYLDTTGLTEGQSTLRREQEPPR